MSDLFSIYEDNLNVVLNNLKKIISSMKNLSKEKTENALNEAHKNLKEADKILKEMEQEVESEKNKSSSNILNVKFRNYKGDVEKNRRHFLKLQENYINKKSQDAMILESYDLKRSKKSQKKNLIENEEDFYSGMDDRKSKKIELINLGNRESKISNNDNEDLDDDNVRDEIFHYEKNQRFCSKLFKKWNKKALMTFIFVVVIVLIILIIALFIRNKQSKEEIK